MKEILIIKLGGSVITDKSRPYTPRKAIIQQIAKELTRIKLPFILIHGSGSFGHTSAKKYGGQKGYSSRNGIATVAQDVLRLNAIVMEILLQEGLPVVSLRPMGMFLTKSGKPVKSFLYPILQLITQGLIAVLYGDGVLDTSWKTTIFSGEKIAFLLGIFLKKNGWNVKVIQLTNSKGVEDTAGKPIPVITTKTWSKVKQHIYSVDDATGGMQHKVEQALQLTKHKIPTWIINGNKEGVLTKVLKGGKVDGTFIC